MSDAKVLYKNTHKQMLSIFEQCCERLEKEIGNTNYERGFYDGVYSCMTIMYRVREELEKGEANAG